MFLLSFTTVHSYNTMHHHSFWLFCVCSISQNKLTALLKHYKERGLEPRKKKSGGRVGKTALTAEDTERVVKYLQTYAEDHALVLPGRVPGFKKSDIKLLPSSDTKRVIWRRYSDAALAAGKDCYQFH